MPSAELPAAASRAGVVVPSCSASARARWAGVISGWPAAWAERWATARASATLVVGFSSMRGLSCDEVGDGVPREATRAKVEPIPLNSRHVGRRSAGRGERDGLGVVGGGGGRRGARRLGRRSSSAWGWGSARPTGSGFDAGGFRLFFTRARILAKSGLPGCTTSEVNGSERIEPPFWMRSARSTHAGSSLARDVDAHVVLHDLGELGVALQQPHRVGLLHQGAGDAPLAPHPAEVVAAGARTGVPERVAAVEVLQPGLDLLLLVAGELDAAAGRGVALDAHLLLHVDVDAAHGVDQRLEAAQVDDDRLLDVEAGDLADDVDGRLPARGS